MKPFSPCRRCGKKSDPSDRSPIGFYRDPDIPGNVIECPHHAEWRDRTNKIRKYTRRGFREDGWDLVYPGGYVGDRSRHNMETVLEYVESFKTSGSLRKHTLYFCGPQGCQKTLIASYVGAELTRAGFDCRFVVMNDLVKKLLEIKFDDGATEYVDDLQRADLIIYDESFDLDKLTLYKSGYQIPFLDTFLRSNLRKHGNIFISNVYPNEIDDKFGPSIRDLMQREVEYFDTLLTFTDNWRNGNGIPKDTLFTRRRHDG